MFILNISQIDLVPLICLFFSLFHSRYHLLQKYRTYYTFLIVPSLYIYQRLTKNLFIRVVEIDAQDKTYCLFVKVTEYSLTPKFLRKLKCF